MITDVIVDTEPLIAFVDRNDQYHDWVRAQFNDILPPLATCEAVLTEACHLARRVPDGVPALMNLFERGVCAVTFALAPNLADVSNYMQKYLDLPCSLADACLVRMSESMPQGVVTTLDTDFRVYRRNKRKRIPLLMPPGR